MSIKVVKKKVGRPKNVPDKELMPIRELAYMFAMAHQTIRDWGKKGAINKTGHGKYEAKSVFDYMLKRDCAGDLGGNSGSKISDEDILISKALYEKAKADVAECEVAIEKGNLVLDKDISSYTINLLTIFKREMLALPRVLPISLYGLDKDEMVEYLKDNVQRVYDDVLDSTEYSAFIKKMQ